MYSLTARIKRVTTVYKLIPQFREPSTSSLIVSSIGIFTSVIDVYIFPHCLISFLVTHIPGISKKTEANREVMVLAIATIVSGDVRAKLWAGSSS
jgi:hypothetical protein